MKGGNGVDDREYSSPNGVTTTGLLLTLLAALSIFLLAVGTSQMFSSHPGEIEKQIVHWEALYEVSPSLLCTASYNGPVLNGTDVVAYFGLNPQEKAVRGSPAHTSHLGDYTFWFSTEANKKTFEGDPFRYAPQWGAFCAWGIAEEEFWGVNILGPYADPDFWMISKEGKLYIFRW
ncbi:unnamed protein product [Choristocarpus tenellus]